MTERNRNKTILMLSTLPWRFDLKYLKNLAMGLSKRANVIYYYPFQEPINIFKSRNNHQQLSLLYESFHSYNKPLTIYVPFTIIPFSRFAFVRTVNSFLNKNLLKLISTVKSIGKTSYLFVTYPFDTSFISSFPADKIIYDCMDIPRSGVNQADDKRVWSNHKQIARAADFIFVNSSSLRSLCVRYNKRTYLVPSGFVYDEFQKSKTNQLPKTLANIKRPFIGFIGLTFVHLDIPLLLKIIPKCGEMSFIFVGPTYGLTKYSNTSQGDYFKYKTLWKKLLSLPNVHHFGKQKRKTLGAYISAFNVCIIPYDLQQKSALYANAIKAYEYLYLGRRIVSTPLKPLINLKSFITFASTAGKFSNAIRMSLQKPMTKEEYDNRRDAAEFHDIDHKVTAIMSTLSLTDKHVVRKL